MFVYVMRIEVILRDNCPLTPVLNNDVIRQLDDMHSEAKRNLILR